jgi:hypothetical protein
MATSSAPQVAASWMALVTAFLDKVDPSVVTRMRWYMWVLLRVVEAFSLSLMADPVLDACQASNRGLGVLFGYV